MMKFGIILENSRLHPWQRKVLEDTQKSPARLELIINTSIADEQTARASHLIYRGWRKYHSKHISSAKVDLLSISTAKETDVITCAMTSHGNNQYTIDTAMADNIKSHGLDFILCFSSRLPGGAILDSARLGVWSFNHDQQKQRDLIACFWDMYDLVPEIDAVLQRLTTDADKSIVLQTSSIKNTKHSVRRNLKALREASIPMVRGAIVDILHGAVDPNGTAAYTGTPALPTNLEMLRFCSRTFYHQVKNLLRMAFLNDHWQLAASRTTTDEILANGLKDISILKAGDINSFYYADPFILNDSANSLAIFAEKLDCKSRRGSLVNVGVSFDANGIRETTTTTVLEMPTHLAYPSIVRTADKNYLIPDSRQYGRILIHDIDDAGTISSQAVLIDDRKLNDPTVFFHDSKYWLFATTQQGELYIWYSSNLTDGWRPHEKQPAMVSPSRTRGAGAVFLHNNALIRPTQDCSEHYGKQIYLNRICVLNEHSFLQETIGKIPPIVDGVTFDGLHTISAGQHHVVVDLRTMHLDIFKAFKIVYRSTKTKILYKIRPGQPKFPAWLP